MSLFIGFVPIYVEAKELSDAFAETFDVTALVHFSKDKVNKNNVKYRSATIELITTSRSMIHFMEQIDEYESNTFIANKNKYRVQYAKERVSVPQIKFVKPYVM